MTCCLFCSSCTTLIMLHIFGIIRGEWIMNQPDVVLFEKIACCSQSNTCVHFSSLFTSLQSTGMSACNDCNVCGKYFKRLESHVSQNLACISYNMSRGVNAAATVSPNIPNESSHVNTNQPCVARGFSQLPEFEESFYV